MEYLRLILRAVNEKGAGIKSFEYRKNGKVVLYFHNLDKIPEFYGSRYECILYLIYAYNLKKDYKIESDYTTPNKFKRSNNLFDEVIFFDNIDNIMLGKFGIYDYSMFARETILSQFLNIREKYSLNTAVMYNLKSKLILKYENIMNESNSQKQFVLHKFVTFFEKLRCD